MIAILFLLAPVVLGAAMVKRLFPFTTRAERILWGTVLGTMLATWIAYVLSRLLNDLKHCAITALTIVLCGLAAVVVYRDYRWSVRFEKIKAALRSERWLIYLVALFGLVFARFCYAGMFHSKEGTLQLTLTSWYDMALHLALASSFAYGHNFPPQYLILPDEALRYPVLPDFHAAILLKLGFGMWPTFAVTSFMMGVAFVGIFFCFVRRLIDSPSASFVATLLFFLNGGVGFLLFWKEWRESRLPWLSYLLNMKENYTDYWNEGLKWANIVTSGVIPQRAMLYGMPIGFIVLTLIAITWRRWSEMESGKRWDGIRLLLPAGIITGLLPLFHVHSYVAIGFVSCVLFLLRPRAVWLAFWIPAVLIAVPALLDIQSHLHSEKTLRFQPGWMSYLGDNFWLFVIRNFGLPLLLLVPALVGRTPNYLRTFYIPFAGLIAFCFFFVISANDFDNLKLMYYGYSVAAAVIAAWLCRSGARPGMRALVVLAILCSTASGALAIIREAGLVHGIFAPEELEAGFFARQKLPAKAIFLTGQYHNQPALCLAGKPIVLGYEFWVSSHGYPRSHYDSILRDVEVMYRGGLNARALIGKYKVDYIYVGPKERAEFSANENDFRQHYAVAFRNRDITIYDTRPRPAN